MKPEFEAYLYTARTKKDYTNKYMKVLEKCFEAYCLQPQSTSAGFSPEQIDDMCGQVFNGSPELKPLIKTDHLDDFDCIFCDKKHSSTFHYKISKMLISIIDTSN
jgi:hypothetical protein